MSVPSTGVANTQRRMCIPMDCSRMSTNEYPKPATIVSAEMSNVKFAIPAIRRTLLKAKRLVRR